jgi:hypothetical protein
LAQRGRITAPTCINGGQLAIMRVPERGVHDFRAST